MTLAMVMKLSFIAVKAFEKNSLIFKEDEHRPINWETMSFKTWQIFGKQYQYFFVAIEFEDTCIILYL